MWQAGEFLAKYKGPRQEKDGVLGEKGNPLMRSGKKWKDEGWRIGLDSKGAESWKSFNWDVTVIKCSFCRITLNIARDSTMV